MAGFFRNLPWGSPFRQIACLFCRGRSCPGEGPRRPRLIISHCDCVRKKYRSAGNPFLPLSVIASPCKGRGNLPFHLSPPPHRGRRSPAKGWFRKAGVRVYEFRHRERCEAISGLRLHFHVSQFQNMTVRVSEIYHVHTLCPINSQFGHQCGAVGNRF